jgi:hypothetical protein
MSYAVDLSFGMNSQKEVITELDSYFDTSFTELSRFSLFDFVGKNNTIYVELKSRRITHNQYPTSLIGKNKIEFCNDPLKKYYFVFSYIDGMYYIEYDKKVFSKFECSKYKRGERVGIYDGEKETIFIPTNLLKPLKNKKPSPPPSRPKTPPSPIRKSPFEK